MTDKKMCTKCKLKKELTSENFGKCKNSKDGFKPVCKSCKKIENKKYSDSKKRYRELHRNEINEKHRKKYTENILSERKRSAKYREENKSKRVETCQKYNKNNKQKIASYQKEWNKKNKDKVSAKTAKRRAALLRATGPWTDDKEINKIYKRCSEMNISGTEKYEVDHIYPLQGKTVCGLHTHFNLQIITQEKNRKKSNKIPENNIV